MSVSRVFRIEHRDGPRYALETGDGRRLIEGDVFAGPPYKTGENVADGMRILAPVTPSKVVAIGLNYKDHAAEMNKPLPAEPLMFLKPSTAVIGPGDDDSNSAERRRGALRGRARRRDRQAGIAGFCR